MGLFNKNTEERSYNIGFTELFNSNGIYIDENKVISIPVVAESINTIANQIAGMPLYLFEDDRKGSITRKRGDYRELLLNEENNEFDTAYKYKYQVVKDLLLYGKSYSFIEWDGNKINGLHHIAFTNAIEKDYIDDDGVIRSKTLHYTLNGKVQNKEINNILVIDMGYKGVLNSKDLLQLLLKYQTTLNARFDNVAMPQGILQAKGRLTRDAVDKLRASWSNLYSGSSNAGKTVILEEGLEYKSLSMDLSDLQMIETKKGLIEDIERIFGLHEVKNDYDKFLKLCLAPYICAIESAINKALLLENEKQKCLFFRFDASELLRPNTKEQFDMMAQTVKAGLMTISEARSFLDMESFFDNPDADKLILSLGNVFIDRQNNISIPNMGINMDAGGNIKNTSTDNLQGTLIA